MPGPEVRSAYALQAWIALSMRIRSAFELRRGIALVLRPPPHPRRACTLWPILRSHRRSSYTTSIVYMRLFRTLHCTNGVRLLFSKSSKSTRRQLSSRSSSSSSAWPPARLNYCGGSSMLAMVPLGLGRRVLDLSRYPRHFAALRCWRNIESRPGAQRSSPCALRMTW